MSFRCKGVNADVLRKELLSKHGVGLISLGQSILRVAYSSVDVEKIPALYKIIYDTAEALVIQKSA
jgi:hypothetical protein